MTLPTRVIFLRLAKIADKDLSPAAACNVFSDF